MNKIKKWTKKELYFLKKMLDEGKDYSSISLILNRSVNALENVWYKKLKYQPKCIGCQKRIPNRKGPRTRCLKCSKIYNRKYHKKYYSDPIRREKYKNNAAEKRYGFNRQKILERDHFKCQKCSKSHHEILLDVHHKDRSGQQKNINLINNNVDNLITLCHSCHTKEHQEELIIRRWRK